MYTAQLMPLPLTVSCFSKIQIGFTFLVLVHPGSPGKRAIKRVCVCGGSLAGETRWGNASAGTVADRTLILIRHGQYDLQSGQLTQLGKRTTRGGGEAVSRAPSVERASVKR